MRVFEVLITMYPVLGISPAGRFVEVGPEVSGGGLILIGVVALLSTCHAPRAGWRTPSRCHLVTRNYIMVARARGKSAWSIVWRELATQCDGGTAGGVWRARRLGPILIGTLGFLGVGVRPPTPEWGLMMAEGRVALGVQPITVLAPAIALAGLVIGINLTTDGLARLLGRQVQYGK